MITKEQAISLTHGDDVHFEPCRKFIGPRGGITIVEIDAPET